MEYKEYRDGDAFISQKRIYFADANPTKDISLQQIMKILGFSSETKRPLT